MKGKVICLVLATLVLTMIPLQSALSTMPTFRNELGEIIPVTDWGQPGVDFEDLQLIGCFKVGSLNLPHGTSEAYLKDCELEETLDSVLVHHKVYYVKQVFEGLEPGDTLISVGTDSVRVPDLSQVYLLMQKPGGIVLDAVFDLYEVEATVYAEPVYYYFPDVEPDDPLWTDQWNLKNPNPQSDEFGIGCPTAWDSESGSTEVKVGVIDRGIYYDHYDLGGAGFPNDKVAGGYDYAEDDPDPIDPCGHGTKCAGIIGALTCNFYCVAGIGGGWDTWPIYDTGVEIYALKVGPDNCDAPFVLPAIVHAIYAGAHPDSFGCSILSNSWGRPGGAPDPLVKAAISTAYQLGVSFVASKGNENTDDPHYPSDYDEHWITAVGSYGQDGVRCTNDNCGYGSNFGGGIDIVAPGTGVPSTNTGGGCVTDFDGTSAACPHASGTIALIRSLVPGLRNEDTDWILKYSAWDPPSDLDPEAEPDENEWTWNAYYGHGHLRASAAIQRIDFPGGQSLMEFFSHTATGVPQVNEIGHGALWRFAGGPLQGSYTVDVYDVRLSVTYPESFSDVPYVWGIGRRELGWSAAEPNFQEGFCRVYPESQTLTGCVLQTFVYYVYEEQEWFPCHYNDIALEYRSWGMPFEITPWGPELGKLSRSELPKDLALLGNYPNPFNSNTSIRIAVPERSHVLLSIYDILGREVNTLLSRSLEAGYHSVRWNGGNGKGEQVPSGIYFSALESNGRVVTSRMIIVK